MRAPVVAWPAARARTCLRKGSICGRFFGELWAIGVAIFFNLYPVQLRGVHLLGLVALLDRGAMHLCTVPLRGRLRRWLRWSLRKQR